MLIFIWLSHIDLLFKFRTALPDVKRNAARKLDGTSSAKKEPTGTGGTPGKGGLVSALKSTFAGYVPVALGGTPAKASAKVSSSPTLSDSSKMDGDLVPDEYLQYGSPE